MKRYVVSGELVEYCQTDPSGNCDWDLKRHDLYECESMETAKEVLKRIEEGKDTYDAVNLYIYEIRY